MIFFKHTHTHTHK